MNGIIGPVLFLAYKGRKETESIAMLHHIACMLLLLSGERSFAVSLNQPIGQKLYLDLPLDNAHYGDLLFQVAFKLLTEGPPQSEGLHGVLLSVLVNVSPYVKSLTMMTAVTVVRLFESYARNAFTHQCAYRSLVDLLEVINNFIQYQFEGSGPLVYAILRRRQVFEHFAQIQAQYLTAQTQAQHATELAAPTLPAESHKTTGDITEPSAVTHSSTNESVEEQPASIEPTAATDTQIESTEVKTDTAAESVSQAPPPSQPTTEAEPPAAPTTAAAPPAAQMVQAQAFVATPEWVASWIGRLPLQPVIRTIQALAQQVQEYCSQYVIVVCC